VLASPKKILFFLLDVNKVTERRNHFAKMRIELKREVMVPPFDRLVVRFKHVEDSRDDLCTGFSVFTWP